MTDEKKTDLDELLEEATERGRLRKENSQLREENRQLEEALASTRRALDLSEKIEGSRPAPPRWTRTKGKGKHPALPVLMLTDTHYEEVVNPEEVFFLNKYNREIGYQRTERAFQGAVKFCQDYIAGHSFEGFVLLLGGDMFNGDLHEDSRETNENTIVEALVYWLEPLLAGIRLLADEFGKVHIAGVVGNHTRRSRYPRYKKRVVDNYDWLLYSLLGRELRTDENITVQFPTSADALVSVYDTRLLVTHGDQFKGGSGISAAMSPMLLGEHRKVKKHAAASRYGGDDVSFDIMVLGHFHTRYVLPRVIAGNALKGYDEYAFINSFDYSLASQELMVIAPERGCIVNAPIFVQDRQAEGW